MNDDSRQPKALVCPLDWGWGHSARMIPLIHLMRKTGFRVIVGISGESGDFLKGELTEYSFLNLPSYKIRYAENGNQFFAILKLLPNILTSVFTEHKNIKKIVEKENIDVVVSDQRYGLWSKKAYSIFITHQLNVIFPERIGCLSSLFNFLQHKFIDRYDECWVPDDKKTLNISGILSDVPKGLSKVLDIGLLSRFEPIQQVKEHKESTYDLLVLLSGPEPQRTILENILLSQLSKDNFRVFFVRGTKNQSKLVSNNKNIKIVDYVYSGELQQIFLQSDMVICRAGYSTIMDLVRLRKKALLIPTPGQTEQEYLAAHLKRKQFFYSVNQDDVQLSGNIEIAAKFNPPEREDPCSKNLQNKLRALYKALYNKKSSYHHNHS
ncbi:MAG: glycosyltransferase [Bacteroidales bacterium]